MNFNDYIDLMNRVLTQPHDYPAYQEADYLTYTKLNVSRSARWLKKFELSESAKAALKAVSEAQTWLVITEPWCGDAAHSVPMLYLMSQVNPLITFEVELRDSKPFSIKHYLTNGAQAIPKLIIRNAQGEDSAIWGPRPAACQQLFEQLKAEGLSLDAIKTEVQNWYNADKGACIQQEIVAILSSK